MAKETAALLKKAEPAPDTHPYLVSKGVRAHGILQHDDKLLIPLQDGAGAVWSYQSIDANGEKLFPYCARKEGCFFVIGKLDPTGEILIFEGFATAASVHEATEKSVVVALDCGNLRSVGDALKGKYPEALLVFCADSDAWTAGNPGENKAVAAARALGGKVAVPIFSKPRLAGQTDFNDLAAAEGQDAVRESIAKAKTPEIDVAAEIESLTRVDNVINFEMALTAMSKNLNIGKRALRQAVKEKQRDAHQPKGPRFDRSLMPDAADAPAGRLHAVDRYEARPNGIYFSKPTMAGDVWQKITNFCAWIVGECVEDDGVERRALLEIEAEIYGRTVGFTVAATHFSALNWALENIGADAVVEPGFGSRDQARAAIQYLSGRVPRHHTYAHLGWRVIDGEWQYLHTGGAVGARGALTTVNVAMPGALTHYALPPIGTSQELGAAVRSSLALLDLAADRISVPLLGATYRALLGNIDFSLHLSGFTGTGKSELAALAQQHFGAEMHAKRLPGSWSSTANQLEGLAFFAKDAIFVIDDFIPQGSTIDRARLNSGC